MLWLEIGVAVFAFWLAFDLWDFSLVAVVVVDVLVLVLADVVEVFGV